MHDMVEGCLEYLTKVEFISYPSHLTEINALLDSDDVEQIQWGWNGNH